MPAVPTAPPFHIVLDSADDAPGFRHALQHLLHHGVSPDMVTWAVSAQAAPVVHPLTVTPKAQVAQVVQAVHVSPTGAAMPAHRLPGPAMQHDLFAEQATVLTVPDIEAQLSGCAPLTWHPGFDALLRSVVMHSQADRFAQLHRFAWRLKDKPALWRDTLDMDRLALNLMSRQVSRDIHKMHAFVRFRPVSPADESAHGTPDAPRYVAWFEPDHHILKAAAPFFARRFAAMHWAIYTPQGSVQWNRKELVHGPAVDVSRAPPPDAGDILWQTYYRHTFNPARVKVDMMKREMPVRYWKHLPEACTIAPLLAEAPTRVAHMVSHTECQRKPDT